MSKNITRSSEIRYVSYFHNQYRLSVPVRSNESNCRHVYMPISTPLIDIKAKIIGVMESGGLDEDEINILMKGWPLKTYESGRRVKRVVRPIFGNQAGYLGVSVRGGSKSVVYLASFNRDGKNVGKMRCSVALNKGFVEGFYWLKRSELENAFVDCCIKADELRGLVVKKRFEYLEFYKDVDWEPLINKMRASKTRTRVGTSLRVCIADSLESAFA